MRTERPMRITLSDERRQRILTELRRFHEESFEDELSVYRAERILEFMVRELGPSVYNQAIQDARGFMAERLEDLDAEFYEKEPD